MASLEPPHPKYRFLCHPGCAHTSLLQLGFGICSYFQCNLHFIWYIGHTAICSLYWMYVHQKYILDVISKILCLYFQISSKLYVFDPETHSWKERGRGELHLNDSLQSSPSEIPQSRIGMHSV